MRDVHELHGERHLPVSTGQDRTGEVFGRRAISYRNAATTAPVNGPTQNLHCARDAHLSLPALTGPPNLRQGHSN